MLYNLDIKEVEDISKEKIGEHQNIHYVYKEGEFNEHMCDCHTHGLSGLTGYECQIVLLMPIEFNQYVLNKICAFSMKGYRFKAGDEIRGLFKNKDMGVKLMKAYDHDGMEIMRILLPDKDGCFGKDAYYPYNCQKFEPYKNQKQVESNNV